MLCMVSPGNGVLGCSISAIWEHVLIGTSEMKVRGELMRARRQRPISRLAFPVANAPTGVSVLPSAILARDWKRAGRRPAPTFSPGDDVNCFGAWDAARNQL